MGAQTSKSSEPVLCQLISQGKTQECLSELAKGGDCGAVDSQGRTPLRLALEFGDAEVLKVLSTTHAPLRPPLPSGTSFLHFSVSNGHYNLTKSLLRDCPRLKNLRDNRGRTALHIAVLREDAEMLALLLKYNCGTAVKDSEGHTASELAQKSDPEMREIRELLAAYESTEAQAVTVPTRSIPSSPKHARDRGSQSTAKSSVAAYDLPTDEFLETAVSLDDEVRDSGVRIIRSAELIFLELINRGSSCEVFKASWRGAEVAVKKFREEYRDNPKESAKFLKELKALACVKHRNVLQLLGICTDLPNLCFITEFVPNKNLFHALHSDNYTENPTYRFSIIDRFNVSIQICEGLAYLHSCKPPIIHRDLKPENCLLDHRRNVKIADFGLARPLTSFTNAEEMTTTCIGTTRFMAPELFEKEKVANIGTEVDIWALGCVLIEVFSERRPWDYIATNNLTCFYYEVRVPQLFKRKPVPIPETVPEEVREVIERCCDYAPVRRPSAREVRAMLLAACRLYR